MKYSNKEVDRIIKIIDYIPVQLRTEGECQATESFSIRKGDHSLLEFAFDEQDATIHRITLLICEEYRRISQLYCIPDDHRSGDVLAGTAGEINSQIFCCEIYPNAVRIIVSSDEISDRILSSNVFWELSGRGDLVSICILDSTGKMSDHCFNELEANQT